MKRYFLIIALLTLAFLWLGNYSVGQFDDNWLLQCDELDLLSSQQAFFCECWIQPELWDNLWWYMNYVQKKGDNNWCCVVEWWKDIFNWVLSLCTSADQNKWEECIPQKANAHVNWIWTCACDENYKDVDGVCKPCSDPDVCCGVKLNTNVPFVGDCIENKDENPNSNVTEENAFPVLMSSLTKMLVTIILIVSFVLIVVWGIMIASAWANQSNASAGKKLIMKVVIGIALLGASGVILRLINPNFFG